MGEEQDVTCHGMGPITDYRDALTPFLSSLEEGWVSWLEGDGNLELEGDFALLDG
jgi:hypothetical protein